MEYLPDIHFGVLIIAVCALLAPVGVIVFFFGIATTVAFLQGKFPRKPVAVFWIVFLLSAGVQLTNMEVPLGLGMYCAATLPMAVMFWYTDRKMDQDKRRILEEEQEKKLLQLMQNHHEL